MADAPRRSTPLGYALLAPSLFGVVAFLLLPILVVIWLSLYRWDLLGPLRYVGLANWRAVLADADFGNSLIVTAVFVAIVVPAQTVLGLAAATMLARELPGTGLFRTLYVLPWICAPLAIAVLWRWILAPTDGAVSAVLGHSIGWLSDPSFALPLVSAVVVWTNVGYVSLSFLAGLLAIPADIYAAARTDGATAWQRFWRIMVPLMKPAILVALLFRTLDAFRIFDNIYILTSGANGTSSVSMLNYDNLFTGFNFGIGSAMSVLILICVAIIATIFIKGFGTAAPGTDIRR